jgi:hypothetical protein
VYARPYDPGPVTNLGRIAAFLAGGTLVLWVLWSAVKTVVVPRGEPVMLTRAVFVALRKLFDLRLSRVRTYEARDRTMAMYAPLGLVLMPGSWVALVIVGFTGVYWGLGIDPLRAAFTTSGSSLLTLGIARPPDLPTTVCVFIEATLGLGLVGLLISYLPSIYSAFQRRELMVSSLTTRAGEPPSAAEMIIRHHVLGRLDALDDMWEPWEQWFEDVEETHTSQPSLVFFRAISHERSWVTSAGVVLDTASLRASTLDLPRSPRAELCIRSGFLALRRIGTYFQLPMPALPQHGDPVSIHRSEFDEVYDELARAGVPLKADRDLAWDDFAGWRVNYDAPLLGLAALTMAPYAMWSSDRSMAVHLPRVVRRRRL